MKKYFFFLFSIFLISCETFDHASRPATIYNQLNIKLLSEQESVQDINAHRMGALLAVFTDPLDSTKTFSAPECSAIQLSSHHILTARHCIRNNLVFNPYRIAKEEDTKKFEIFIIGDLLRLIYNGNLIPKSESFENNSLLGPPIYKDDELDFSIFYSKEKLNGTSLGFADLSDGFGEAVLYGYPNGLPLGKSGECMVSGGKDEAIIHHNCASLSGSSGGLLVNINDQKPVGMHVAGSLPNRGHFYENNRRFESSAEIAASLNCTPDIDLSGRESWEKCIKLFGLNSAIKFSFVKRQLAAKKPELLSNILDLSADVSADELKNLPTPTLEPAPALNHVFGSTVTAPE